MRRIFTFARTVHGSLRIAAFSFFLIPVSGQAQQLNDPDLQSLVDAEIAFSNLARQRSTRAAFLEFLADSAITFGRDARIGKKHLELQADDQSWLSWRPVYTDISSSGDFGFNTGPWELRENHADGQPVAFGQFATVWKKINGQWKALIDIGIAHEKPLSEDSLLTSSVNLKNIQAVAKSTMHKVIAEEQKFIADYARRNTAAYPQVLSKDARLLRNNFLPQQNGIVPTGSNAAGYRFIDGEVSQAGDLAYVYGKALIEKNKSASGGSIDANYMRVWKKEDGKNWKIVLDVLSYLE